MKKFFCVLLCLSLVLCGLPSAVSAQTTSNSSQIVISGKVNMNLDYDGSKMLNNLSPAILNVNSISFAGSDELDLDGSIMYGNNTYPINLTSTVYRSSLSENQSHDTIVGNSIDRDSNFNVSYLGISNNISGNKLMVNHSLSDGTVLQLYLLRKGTRELSMFEIPINNYSLLKQNVNKCNYGKLQENSIPSKDQWWISVFKPTITITSDNSVNTSDVTNASKVKPLTSLLTQDNETQTITYYNGPSNCYKYVITLHAGANVYSYGTTTNQTDGFQLNVTSNKYYYDGTLMSDVFLKVFNCVGSEVLTSTSSTNKDFITTVNWGNQTTSTTGGLSITPAITIGTLINASITWTPTNLTVTSRGPEIFTNTTTQGFKLTFLDPLQATTDYYTLTMQKNKVSPSTLQKISGAVFTYDIGFIGADEVLSSGELVPSCTYY